jgi:hypothetical protein
MTNDPWQPTLKLRFLKRATGPHSPSAHVTVYPPAIINLQQLYRHATSGETEWRDVQIENEDDG